MPARPITAGQPSARAINPDARDRSQSISTSLASSCVIASALWLSSNTEPYSRSLLDTHAGRSRLVNRTFTGACRTSVARNSSDADEPSKLW